MKHILHNNIYKLFINKNSTVYKIILTLLLSWIYGLSSQTCIILPFEFIPITLQTLTLFLAPLVFGRIAFYASCLWYIQGILGLPMFFGFSGGITHILGPTGGYLIGFLISSFYLSNVKSKNIISLFFNLFISIIILHSFGIKHLLNFVPLNINMLLFILVDIVKILLIPFIIMAFKKDNFN